MSHMTPCILFTSGSKATTCWGNVLPRTRNDIHTQHSRMVGAPVRTLRVCACHVQGGTGA